MPDVTVIECGEEIDCHTCKRQGGHVTHLCKCGVEWDTGDIAEPWGFRKPRETN